jgi:hypothetical protein
MGIFGKKKQEAASLNGKGIVLMREVPDAMRAEKILRKASFSVRLVAPPPQFREGCDLAVESDIMEQLAVERTLAQNSIPIIRTVPLGTDSIEPISVVSVVNYDGATMVRAGNMKMTFDRHTGDILNISGGGCPDVPHLYAQFVGRNIEEASRPRETGFTLCALMLDRAFEECLRLYQE